jgi:hypothetical protein
VNKVCVRELFRETGQAVSQERNIRVVRVAVSDNSSCGQFYDKKDVEPLKTEDVNGEEVAGEKGIPMGFEKSFP